MTTDVDIANRALIMVGSQNIVLDLTQDILEAKAINAVYLPIRNWCFGLSNWHFARKTAILTLLKSVAAGPPSPWSSVSPSPPWQREYAVPADFVQLRYLTDSSLTSTTNYTGDLQRVQVANDTVIAVQQQVILTNIANAVLVYTGLVTDPTLWPWYFERLVVYALAWNIAATLVDRDEAKIQKQNTIEQFVIADQANRQEGLAFEDGTPEWIQAIGVNYPFNRPTGQENQKPKKGDK